MEEFLTPAEVADRLRVTQQAVTSWCRSGKLRAKRAGRIWRILPSDVETFLNTHDQEVQSKQDPSKKADGLAHYQY